MICRIYKDASGTWRWKLVAKNGKIVADSGEGYHTQRGAIRAAQRMANPDVQLAFSHHRRPILPPQRVKGSS